MPLESDADFWSLHLLFVMVAKFGVLVCDLISLAISFVLLSSPFLLLLFAFTTLFLFSSSSPFLRFCSESRRIDNETTQKKMYHYLRISSLLFGGFNALFRLCNTVCACLTFFVRLLISTECAYFFGLMSMICFSILLLDVVVS